MYCARCGKIFSLHEPRIYAVLHGRPKHKVLTCYDDRLCERRIIVPTVANPVVVVIVRTGKSKIVKGRDTAKEMSSKFVRPWK